MKINQKITSKLVIIFSVITICLGALSLLKYINAGIAIIFLCITEILLGLNQIDKGKNIDPKGIGKNNKIIGIFWMVVWGIIITLFIVEKVVWH